VQKGLEAAFRKRQNLALKERRDEVVAALRRVAFEPLEDEGALRRLFTEVSEYLSQVVAYKSPECMMIASLIRGPSPSAAPRNAYDCMRIASPLSA
jgi:hypothetical protein